VFPRPIAECDNDWRSGRIANRWPRRAPTLEIASAPDGAPGSCVARLCKQVSLGPLWPYSPQGAKGVPSLWRKADRGVNCCRPSRISFALGPGARQKVRYVSTKGSHFFACLFYLKYAHTTKRPRSLPGSVVGYKSSEGRFTGIALAAIPLRQLLRYLVGVAYQYFVGEAVTN
jgi:hypothetical protein